MTIPDVTAIRNAWVEIDTVQLAQNFAIIDRYAPAQLKRLCVVKDNAYGHGAITTARLALAHGYCYLAVETINEAYELRQDDIQAPILLFGEASLEELEACVAFNITPCINSAYRAKQLNDLLLQADKTLSVHVEVDTGMSRWGISDTQAVEWITTLATDYSHLRLEGVMSHFAMSDEADKSFAMHQLARFNQVIQHPDVEALELPYIHMSNTGGLLDLHDAHFTMVRTGILPFGIYPSLVCNQYPGLKPVMSVKAKVMTLRDLSVGDRVGYGMHFTATHPMKIAVLPIGYGDGYPRVRNNGYVLIKGSQCPVVGGNAMDAMMVDVTHLPQVALEDEVVLMGQQGQQYIGPRDLVPWKQTVCYEILTNWRSRLPRIEV